MSGDDEIKKKKKKTNKFGPLFFPVLLLSFAHHMTGIVFTDLLVYRTCSVSLNNNISECFMLRANASSPAALELEAKVEPYASMVVMTKSLMDSLLPAVLALFLGPWSDQGGRKPLLIAGYIGFTLSYFAVSAMCDWNISPWYLLLAWIPANIVGGVYTVLLACVCYTSDITAEEFRMRQLALLEASVYGGDLLGALIGPVIYEYYGCSNIFRTAAVCSATGLLYVHFCLDESVKNVSKKSIRRLFRTSLVRDLVASLTKRRDGFHLPVVWLGILTFTLKAMTYRGQTTIAFLFTRVRLGWDVQRHSYHIAATVILRIIGLCTISLVGPVLGLSDTLLAGIGIASFMGGAITKSFSWKSWHMYLSVCIEIFCGIIGPVTRSIISKSVPSQDVGKVLTLTAFLEASSPLVGAPLYTLIYSYYLPPIYPSPVYLLTVGLCILSIIFVIYISILRRKSPRLSNYVAASQDDKPISRS